MSRFSVRSVAVVTGLLAGCGSEPELWVGPGEVETDDGKADGAEGRAELKVTLAPTDIRRARYRLALLNAQSQTRRIWFFDTPELVVYDGGAILRAREIDGEADDSTVKLRPFTLVELAPEFVALDGLKCELDRSPAASKSACSLKVDQDEGEIAAVGFGERTIDKLFSSEQEAMFAAHGPAVAWDQLAVLGPIRARVWTIRTDALPEKLTAELWYMPDTTQTLELSMKVKVAEADAAMAQLLDFVADKGLTLDADQESKTRRALEAYLATTAP
jgi:hypothetical protein